MRKNGLPPGPGFGLARSGHKPARPKPGPQEPIGQQVLSSITQRTYMVQWEGQSFKSIFLSISTTCRVWFQEGGTGSGTDLRTSPPSILRQDENQASTVSLDHHAEQAANPGGSG